MDFTNNEKRRINELYGTDFKGEMTPDDVKLIAAWEKYKLEQDAEYQLKRKEQEEITARKLELAEEIADIARENLRNSADRSRKRWEKVRYGQEK